MCKISIIILSYNSQSTIIDTLLSAVYQSSPAYEIIISDDCSTDNTLDIAKRKVDELGITVTFHRNNKNLGVTRNANIAARFVMGDYIKFIGADDILHFNYVMEMQKAINAYDKRAELLYSKIIKFTSDSLVYDVMLQDIITDKVKPSYNYIMGQLANTNNIKKQLEIDYEFTPSLLINKDYFVEIGGYNENYLMFEDLPFYIKCIMNKANFLFIDKELVFYRQGVSGITTAGSQYINLKFFDDLLRFFNSEYKEILLNNKLYYRYYTLKIRFFRDKLIVKFGNKRGAIYKITKILLLLDIQTIKKILIKHRKRGIVNANN